VAVGWLQPKNRLRNADQASDPTLVVLVDVSHIQHEGHFSPTGTLRSWTTGKRNAAKGPERRGGSRRVTAVASGGGDATGSLRLIREPTRLYRRVGASGETPEYICDCFCLVYVLKTHTFLPSVAPHLPQHARPEEQPYQPEDDRTNHDANSIRLCHCANNIGFRRQVAHLGNRA
jgi:hypothetical protein